MFNKLLDPHEIAPSFTGTNVTKFSSMLTKAGNDSPNNLATREVFARDLEILWITIGV